MTADELAPLNFEDLGRFKQARAFPHGYPADTLTFYSPRDPGVHEVIVWTLLQAKQSLCFNVYGFDDDEAAALIFAAAHNPTIMVQGNLDSSQAGGVHERKLLAEAPDLVGTRIAVGRSIKSAISHLKLLVVDGLYVISGSTNWSLSGEQKQDNELTLHRDRALAAEARTVCDLNHDAMLGQMAKRAAA